MVHADGSAGHRLRAAQSGLRGEMPPSPSVRKPADSSPRPQCHLGKKEETGGRALVGS